jgi:hypothetical protein
MLDAATDKPFTRDNVSWTDLVALRERCEASGDALCVDVCNRALDQYISYRDYSSSEESVDVDMLDTACDMLNAEQAVTDAAFDDAAVTVELLRTQIEAYQGRKDWRRSLLGAL